MELHQNKITDEKQTQSSMSYDHRIQNGQFPHSMQQELIAARESAEKNRKIAVTATVLLCILVVIVAGLAAYFLLSDDENSSKSSENGIRFGESTSDDGVQVGDYITFGKYEQDNNKNNGAEDIEWLVLDKEDGKVLVISKYVLDCTHYNSDKEDNRWENSTVRTWLNNDFVSTAFTKEEQKKIPTVTVPAHENPDYDVDCGNATKDRMFLLSIEEAEKYLPSSGKRECEITAYALENAIGDAGNSDWLLRTPGRIPRLVSYVMSHGGIDASGVSVGGFFGPIRPAMWINVN